MTTCDAPEWDWLVAEYRVKPEPREWFANLYKESECTPVAILHSSKSNAEREHGRGRSELIHVREVL